MNTKELTPQALMLEALRGVRTWMGEQELQDNGDISIDAVRDLLDMAIAVGEKSPDLVTPLQTCVDWFDNHYDGAPDAGCVDMVEPMEQAQRALNQIKQLGKLYHKEN